ncbi:ABC transporter permease subunit [Microbacterium trichothecenolyticum]|uniref:ABC transporter permease subunit n=1 Tax=Microbacterium ureisolvens TaxID=2781186 RepID=A0ABS7HYS7_9MICO|nr:MULTISPECIES: ABC transporter permease subunit [Microbacterium]MBW9109680.1 ABC transporter permease subunit [Microbacterium ureisolvens]MBW9120298.1 ABC transporter permease subunit [Microbacterium trichothecenolyticum]
MTATAPAAMPLEATPHTAKRATAISRAVGRSLLNALLTFVIVLALWWAVVNLTGISPYVAKGPADVWEFFFTSPEAAENRAEMMPLLAQTLSDAALGFVVGMVVAMVLALAFSLSRSVEMGVMPLALLLRSVPLVAIAPVIILITGRGTPASVAVIGSIVVLFPALASIMFGLSRASKESLDLVHVYGGGRPTQLRKVNVPGALPSLFAAARVSVPGAVTGALLAEWLSTGQGIGGMIQKFSASARFDELWASVALITIVTLLLYNLVQIAENIVLARMGMTTSSR